MAKVKQMFGETRFVPWIGREVQHGETIDVPDDELASYLEGGWEPADKATTAARAKLWDAETVTVGAPPKSAPPKSAPKAEPVAADVKEA